MKIQRRSLRQYREAVDEQAGAARRYVDRALSIYFEQNPNASTADGRNFAIELLKAAMPNFCDSAGTLAADFFDEVCEAEGIDVSSQLYDTTDYSIVEDKVHYFAGRLNDGDVDAFKREVVDATHYFVKRSAYENMIRNCEANEVRYARVPSGFETCSFCFMLASRGFVYRSEDRARGVHGYHDNCDCCIVPGKKGRTVIEGYDPQGMYDRWSACEKTIGGEAAARNAWDSLPQDERDGYIQRHKVEDKAFRQFEVNRIMREAETRDWHWLYTGVEPAISYKPPSLKLEVAKRPHELETAKKLSMNGIKCEFVVDTRKWRDKNGQEYTVGLPDLGDGIELKALLRAKGKGAVDGALRDAGRKEGLKICVIDNSWKKLDDDVVQNEIEDRMLRRHVRECLLIRSDGVMVRIKK